MPGKTLILLAALGMAGLSACDNLTAEQATVVGAAGGAATGLILADALEANKDWKLIAALAGAAAGTVVAQNQRGDGTYYEAPC